MESQKMTERQEDDLAQEALDGRLSAEEVERFRQRLAVAPDLRARADDLARLGRVLASCATPGPPPGLRRKIMRQIREKSASVVAMRRSSQVGGGVMTKKVMYGLTAAAAAIVVILGVTGFPPDTGDIAGTIGAARRAVKPQIAAGDVQVGDTSAQAFLQSEVFDRLIKDPAAVKLLSDPALRHQLSNEFLREFLASEAFATFLRRFGGAFGDVTLRDALTSPRLAAALDNAEVRAALADVQVAAALGVAEVRHLLVDATFLRALGDVEFRMQLAKLRNTVEYTAALDSWLKGNAGQAFARAMLHAEFRDVITNQKFLEALGTIELRAMMQDLKVQAAMHDATFLTAISSTELQGALKNVAFGGALRDGGFVMALADPAVAAALSSELFATAIKSPGFAQALNDTAFSTALLRYGATY
jgi:hypothetical protein